jgi:kinetochore protein Mis13/DSN1
MPPPPPSIHTPQPTLSEIDTSLLDPEQAAILATLQAQPQSSAFTYLSPALLGDHLSKLSSNLESHVDLLADGLHKIEQYRNTAERIADRVLGTASKRLEDRERESKEQVGSEGIGARDLLRGLSGVLNE